MPKRSTHKISKKFVDSLPTSRDAIYFDSNLTGFAVRTKPSGTKTYLVQYRNRENRTRKVSIGQHGVLTPDQARIETGADGVRVLEHLRKSFSDGDNNFEAQFWYGRELYLNSRFDDSYRIFKALHENAPGKFRAKALAPISDAEGNAIVYSGVIRRLESGYAFVRLSHFPNDIFSLPFESDADVWDQLRANAAITGSIAFTRRGPNAVNLQPTS